MARGLIIHSLICCPVLPVLLDDLNRSLLGWGNERVVNPFDEVNDVSTVLLFKPRTLIPILTSSFSK